MASLFLDVFPVGPIQANCVLLGDADAGELVVIDPGEEGERIADRVRASGLRPTMILHTHGHLDHAGGTADLCARLDEGLPVGLHREESELYFNLATQGAMFGLGAETPPEPTLWLEHGKRLKLGKLALDVRHTPGHSPGSVCFVVSGGPEKLVIVGDVLFAGGVGRADLPGASWDVLADSIHRVLFSLPDQTALYPGHGPATTVGRERRTNPWVS